MWKQEICLQNVLNMDDHVHVKNEISIIQMLENQLLHALSICLAEQCK